ncbi:MAG: TerD family protein [Desulfobacterales bacterium]|nr:TerD family protein [Desulfobacterales bacterium]
MAISLSKGGNISLSKEAPGLKTIFVGLGWDVRATDGAAFDLDASAFMLKEDGKVSSERDFIFYNQKESACGSVKHLGDNLTGAGSGDDEVVEINLEKVPAEIKKVVFAVTIHEAETRQQNFGMVSSAFIRVVNKDNTTEIARYDLSEDASLSKAMVFGEVYRHGNEWKFKAVGQGFEGGLDAMARSFGITV